jgi:hypothetical protein
MADWENLVEPSEGRSTTNSIHGIREKPEAKRSTQDRFNESFLNNSSIWKDLREFEAYTAGRMYGNCAGPDQVGSKDILTKFVSMLTHLVQDAYWRADKPVDKDSLHLLELSAKVVGNMESHEISILPIKMLAYLNGFCDGYISTSDPDSVKNLSYGVS